MSRTDVTEKQWRRLESHLPPNPHLGHAYVEDRRVINGILWRFVVIRHIVESQPAISVTEVIRNQG